MPEPNLDALKSSLKVWFNDLWDSAVSYQRDYINGGYQHDEHRWAFSLMTEPYRSYAWQVVHSELRRFERARTGFTTDLGSTHSLDTNIGTMFTDALQNRISGGIILRPGDPDAQLFASMFDGLELLLTAGALPFEMLVLMPGLELPSSTIQLDETSRVDFLTPVERNIQPWTNILPATMAAPPVLRARHRLGIINNKRAPDTRRVSQSVGKAGADLLKSLASVCSVRSVAGFGIVLPSCWNPTIKQFSVEGPTRSLGNTVLEEHHVAPLQTAWREFRGDHLAANVGICAARLGTLGQRQEPADRLVDVLIALEAALGADRSDELTHRLSILAARLTSGRLGRTQSEIRSDVLAAFARRADLLRGRQLENAEQYEELVSRIEAIARTLLAMRIEKAPEFAQGEIRTLLESPAP